MKTRIKNLLLVPLLMAGLGLVLAGRMTAQTFTNLHHFAATSGPLSTNSDGAFPYGRLSLSGNILYGTAGNGGSSGNGTLFKINTDGSGFTNLYSFTPLSVPDETGTNGDGNSPTEVILSGNTLYGTTYGGGSSGNGTVFAINIAGSGFTNLHSFTQGLGPYPGTNSDGLNPRAGLILSDNTLYGTVHRGGSWGRGTVFKVNTDGTGFTTLHTFTASSNGVSPIARLILSGNTLYGTTYEGGSLYYGTVFAVNTDGTGFTNLHSFNQGSDGAHPAAGLILSGNTLYGTASGGGSSSKGTVFAVNTDGSGFTNLHSFNDGSGGGYPQAGLILLENILYGTGGGVFAINTDGTGFTNLHSFTGSDGANPLAGLILSGNTLYGTTSQGGSSGVGTVFSLSLPPPPQLTKIRYADNIVLTWPTNFTGFTLQSTTNFVSPTVWSTNSPVPVVVNGQNTVTNPASATQTFYRLSQ